MDVAGAVKGWIESGKVRPFRRPEAGDDTIRRAHAIEAASAVQSEYSLWTRDPETEVRRTCAESGVAFVPCSPLGAGFLAGTIDSTTSFDRPTCATA